MTADPVMVDRDNLAQATAEYIARELNPAAGNAGYTFYADDRRPPTDVEAIKAELLGGHLWISWMDDAVCAAMKAIHGQHRASSDGRVESGHTIGFRVPTDPK